MKTYKVCVPTDYIMGYLRYGHAEFKIEAESAEEAIKKLQKNKEIIEKMERDEIPDDPDFEDIDYNELVVDDYSIEDYGDFSYGDAYVEDEEDIKEKLARIEKELKDKEEKIKELEDALEYSCEDTEYFIM